MKAVIRFFLYNRFVTVLLVLTLVGVGIAVAPFDWDIPWFPRDPVPVDAIPDLGENQQIVFTAWPGRSPQDIEDQITYPLTTALLGVPGVKTIRSSSMFGFSTIYVIFQEDVDFYWARTRILEKLNSLPPGTLPEGVAPALGPDATALGQIFWYTLEGRDSTGKFVGGWDLHELRTIQDFYIRYALLSVEGVAEVASVGGYVKEYQIELKPEAIRAARVSLQEIVDAVRKSNLDVGASTIEINAVEYVVRGLGYIRSIEDIEQAVIRVDNGVPLTIKDVAFVTIGPAERRGILDKNGIEAVGGVVVARYGENPLAVIDRVKEKIREIQVGLPKRVLPDGTVSQVTIVPFYDRTQLIHETLATLNIALEHELLISIIVVLIMLFNLRASFVIAVTLPIGILMTFLFMKIGGVDANIVALTGIVIAIGTMVDVGIIMSENIVRYVEERKEGSSLLELIHAASVEIAPPLLTAIATTVVSFLPVFSLQATEGKLFRPLAFTKTFALVSVAVIALTMVPAFAYWIFRISVRRQWIRLLWYSLLFVAGIVGYITTPITAFLLLSVASISGIASVLLPRWWDERRHQRALFFTLVVLTAVLLAESWIPLGPRNGVVLNTLFVLVIVSGVLLSFRLFLKLYPRILAWVLEHKGIFLVFPTVLVIMGMMIWLGWGFVLSPIAQLGDAVGINIRTTSWWSWGVHTFPGLQKEFMPSLDEGSFLLMPTALPHTGITQVKSYLAALDKAVAEIPEVEVVVGKAGRVESPLDPAPLGMFENVIIYKPEYKTDEQGRRIRFAVDDDGNFLRDSAGNLIPDPKGEYYRQWRPHIKTADDIWKEIVKRTQFPGLTSAPKLYPIETRLIMLQTGMRAPIGIKVQGPTLEAIERFGLALENILKEVPGIQSETVFADRVVGKPYLEIRFDRQKLARYGLKINDVQRLVEILLGGQPLTTTIEGRERYAVRIRYPRELRSTPAKIASVLISTPMGTMIPLGQVATIEYRQGPQVIKSEDTFLTSYVIFDHDKSISAIEAVERAQRFIQEKIRSGELVVPPGVSYRFSGTYEHQVRAQRRLSIVLPITLAIIFLLLYIQFRSTITSALVFSGIAVAWAGGFLMLWLYGQPWFLDFSIAGVSMRELFQIHPVNLSVAVWVGFIALFGIATDDGVLIATYLDDSFRERRPKTIEEIRQAIIAGGMRRIRPALMTIAVTVLALLPVLSSVGKGSEIMVPMAIPTFGGMTIALMTVFTVPVLYAIVEERRWKRQQQKGEEQ